MDWAAWWALGVYFATLLLPFVMLLIVPGGRKPSSAIAWLLVIAIVPWIGFILFLLLGHPRLPRQRRRRLQEMQDQLRSSVQETMDDPGAPWMRVRLPADQESVATMIEQMGALPPFRGNEVVVLADYDGVLERMVEDIDHAERFVHVQTYIFALDAATAPLVDALLRARRRGVAVRVLIDHMGSRGFMEHPGLMARLRRGGVLVAYALPFQPWRGKLSRPDLRNHRKLLIVDGDVGYIGSQNLLDRRYRKSMAFPTAIHYLELMARTRGPIVQQLDAVFRGDWYAETGRRLRDVPLQQVMAGETLAQVLPSGPGHAHESNLRAFNALLYSATDRIVIVNAYFVPDETMMMALTSAAQRGVDVVLVTPERGNQVLLRFAQRSYYGELLRAGVRIFLHPRPWNLHTKTMTVDDDVCVIGSSNLDIRSFQLNLEVSMVCYDAAVVEQVRAVEQEYIAHSRPLTLEDWQGTPAVVRGIQNVARLTSALQ